jgi:hypothetical protein
MTALLLADVAVETVVKQILFDRGAEFGRQDKLGALLDALVGAFPALKLRPELGAARRLREARNPVQHAGQVPSTAIVEAHLRDAEIFLTLVVKECFGFDFAALSTASFVRTEDLRAALAAATEALRGETVDEANLLLAAAFQSLSVSVRHWMRRARGVDARMEMFAGVWLNEPVIAVYGRSILQRR